MSGPDRAHPPAGAFRVPADGGSQVPPLLPEGVTDPAGLADRLRDHGYLADDGLANAR